VHILKQYGLSGVIIVIIALIMTTNSAWTASLVLENAWCGSLQYPNRVECDHASHLLYVTSPRTGQIAVFDETGALQNVITTVVHPSAIAADGAGNLFTVDGTVVRKLSTSGSVLMSIGDTVPYFAGPHDVAVAADGRLFVSDACDSIKVFNSSGGFLFAFGGHGNLPAELDDPVSLTISDSRNELYVADQNNYRIEVFNLSGNFLRSWGVLGNGLCNPSSFLRLWGLDCDASGRLWVFDDILNEVQLFEPTGAFDTLYTLPDAALQSGVDIAVDGNCMYVTEQSSQCVLDYALTGNAAMNLTLVWSPQGMTLRWNPIPGATGYHLTRCSDVTFGAARVEDLGTVTDTSFVDTQTLSLYDRRFYEVAAVLPGLANVENQTMPGWDDLVHRRSTLDGYHDSPHTIDAGVNCTSCHFSHYAYPNPFSEAWCAERLCKSCHVETGKAAPQQNHFAATDTIYCGTCHNPHSQQPQYPHDFIRTAVSTPHSGDRALTFANGTDFVHGAPNYDGVCEICHTQTAYYRNNSSGDHSHNSGTNCLTCHPHLSGFEPVTQLRNGSRTHLR